MTSSGMMRERGERTSTGRKGSAFYFHLAQRRAHEATSELLEHLLASSMAASLRRSTFERQEAIPDSDPSEPNRNHVPAYFSRTGRESFVAKQDLGKLGKVLG